MRLLIVEDSAIVRERLARLVEEMPGIELLGEPQGTSDAPEAVCRLEPDAVLRITTTDWPRAVETGGYDDTKSASAD